MRRALLTLSLSCLLTAVTSTDFRRSSTTVTSAAGSSTGSRHQPKFNSSSQVSSSLPKTLPTSSKALQQPPHRSVTFNASSLNPSPCDVTFAAPSFLGHVAENLPRGVVVEGLDDLTLISTTANTPHRVVYKLQTSADFLLRHDDSYVTSPLLVANRTFDRETRSSYTLVVLACADVMCRNDVWLRAEVDVTIDDVNDHRPQFDASHYHASVHSDLPPRSDVITLRADDLDLGQVRYEFVEGGLGEEIFSLESDSGVISLAEAQPLTTASHDLRVRAVDAGGLASDVITVSVRITCVLPLIAHDHGSSLRVKRSEYDVYVVRISENATGNLMEFKQRNGRYAYVEKDPFPRMLQVEGDLGYVRLRDGFKLDYETQPSVEFTVVVVARDDPDCKSL